jgi:hypothetical protein
VQARAGPHPKPQIAAPEYRPGEELPQPQAHVHRCSAPGGSHRRGDRWHARVVPREHAGQVRKRAVDHDAGRGDAAGGVPRTGPIPLAITKPCYINPYCRIAVTENATAAVTNPMARSGCLSPAFKNHCIPPAARRPVFNPLAIITPKANSGSHTCTASAPTRMAFRDEIPGVPRTSTHHDMPSTKYLG